MPRHRRCAAPGALSIPRPRRRRQPHPLRRLLPVRCCAPAPPAAFPFQSSPRASTPAPAARAGNLRRRVFIPVRCRLDAPHPRRARGPDRLPSPTPSASRAARVSSSDLQLPQRTGPCSATVTLVDRLRATAVGFAARRCRLRFRLFPVPVATIFRRHPHPPPRPCRSPSRAPRPASPPVPQRAEKNSRRWSQWSTGSRSAAPAAPDSATGASFFSCLCPLARRSRFPFGNSIGSRAAPHRGSLPRPLSNAAGLHPFALPESRIVRGVLLDLLSFLRPAAFSLTPDARNVPLRVAVRQPAWWRKRIMNQ